MRSADLQLCCMAGVIRHWWEARSVAPDPGVEGIGFEGFTLVEFGPRSDTKPQDRVNEGVGE